MYCKHCGKEIADDSAFCQYCGKSLKITNKEHVNIDVNAKVDAHINPQIYGWFQRLSIKQKNLIGIYFVWFVVNVILLVCGDNKRHWFPYIYNTRDYKEFYTNAFKEEWMIDWDLDYYGLPEFIVYTILIPFFVFFMYKLWQQIDNRKPNRQDVTIKKPKSEFSEWENVH